MNGLLLYPKMIVVYRQHTSLSPSLTKKNTFEPLKGVFSTFKRTFRYSPSDTHLRACGRARRPALRLGYREHKKKNLNTSW